MDSKQVSQVTTGTLIIVLGLVLLGGQMRVGLDIGRLWPLIFIVLGIGRFLTTDEQGRRRNGAWLLFLGALFLLNNFHILGLGDSWPLFIVAGGLSMIFGRKDGRPGRGRRRRDEAERAETDRFRERGTQP